MNNFLETAMNFINENTTLLIIICVFLIVVLVCYLIDNSIKTKKLEKEQQVLNNDKIENNITEDIVVNENTVKVEEPAKTEAAVEPIVKEEKEVNEIPALEEAKKEEIPVVEEKEEVLYDEPIEGTSNTISVPQEVNDALLKDFTKNENIQELSENEKSLEDTVVLNPIEPVSTIEEPKKEKTLYTNDKKLSDIFSKPKEDLMNTADLSDELDRILSKLNNNTVNTKDSTLEETTDFTNMF